MSVNSKMTAIADEIRAKTGGTEPLTLDDMAENVPKVYEAGKKSEYDAFWDARQKNGNPTGQRDCEYLFAGAWTKETLRPKYDVISPYSTYMMFARNNAIGDLREFKKGNGEKVILDFSGTKEISYLYYLSGVTYVETLDTTSSATVANMFNYAPVHTIELLKLKEDGSQKIGAWGATSLQNITIEGKIGWNGTTFESEVLTKESISSIINALIDTTSGYALTLKRRAITSAFGSVDNAEWQALVASKPNWTISLV